MERVGAVVIGRNEGDRLRACLASLAGAVDAVVYVDSGSSDGSVALARAMGARIVELDGDRPFGAARARNAGLAALREEPEIGFVQLVDGDCVVQPGWIAAARACLLSDPRLAIVCGRRRERDPGASVFNRLCDREWDTPVGEARACGGDAFVRAGALAAIGGFREDLIAGEEPELCLRLRRAGWRIRRIDREMTLHDAAMTRLSQWWRRAERAGHAFAEGAALHGAGPERHWVAPTLRALAWGLVLPIVATLAALASGPLALALLAAYPLQIARLAHRDGARRASVEWAAFATLAKVPEAIGVLRYLIGRRLMGRRPRLLEYK